MGQRGARSPFSQPAIGDACSPTMVGDPRLCCVEQWTTTGASATARQGLHQVHQTLGRIASGIDRLSTVSGPRLSRDCAPRRQVDARPEREQCERPAGAIRFIGASSVPYPASHHCRPARDP